MLFGFLLIRLYDNFICHLSILGMLSSRPGWTVPYRQAWLFFLGGYFFLYWEEEREKSHTLDQYGCINTRVLPKRVFQKGSFFRQGLGETWSVILPIHRLWWGLLVSLAVEQLPCNLYSCSQRSSSLSVWLFAPYTADGAAKSCS